jgi:rubrerythrin
MSNSKAHIAEVLRRAIRGEEDGYKFYGLMVDKADNPDARRKLEGLRDDEIGHKKTLVELFAKYVGGEIGELPAKGLSVLSEVFAKGHFSELKTEMEFINLAIEAELAATKFYQKERDLVEDPEFARILDRLAEEEHSHFELLQAEKDAMSGNYHWFSYDGSSPMEH